MSKYRDDSQPPWVGPPAEQPGRGLIPFDAGALAAAQKPADALVQNLIGDIRREARGRKFWDMLPPELMPMLEHNTTKSFPTMRNGRSMSEFREAMALQALVLIRVFDEFARQNQLKPFSAQIGSQDDVAFAVLTKSCSLIVVGRPEGGRRATAYVKNKERASTSIPSISQAIHGTTEIGSQMFIDGRHTSPVYKLYATDTGSSGGLEDMEASVAGLEESVASVQRQTIDSVSFRKLPD